MKTSAPAMTAAISCTLALFATGCDRMASKPARSDSAAPSAAGSAAVPATATGSAASDINPDAAAYTDGKPKWAGSRKHNAQDNIDFQFKKNGSDFGAASADDYVAKVHAFISSPPAGVQTATRDRNGDKLYYDAGSNTFAVVSRKGAPKTMFKPRNGKAYWERQQASLNDPGRRGPAKGGDGADNG